MKRQISKLFSLLFCLSLLFSTCAVQNVSAEDKAPKKSQPTQTYSDNPLGLPAAEPFAAQQTLQNSSTTDSFGYTYSVISYNWIDAAALGANSGLTGDDAVSDTYVLPFSFKFYENAYTSLYFSTNGLITFNSPSDSYNNTDLPNTSTPNNLIAPFWNDLDVGASHTAGAIFVYQNTSAAIPYVVIEWKDVSYHSSSAASDHLNFEAILYQNGNIVFQYQNLTGSFQLATVGIEDSYGEIGLQYPSASLGSNLAIQITRPAASARMTITPLMQGSFTTSNTKSTYNVTIRNNGDRGTDTFDLTPTTTWAAGYYQSNGITPLTDTNSDGKIDTGAIVQGGYFNMVVSVQSPSNAIPGNNNTLSIAVTSSIDNSVTQTITLQTALPAAFAQSYYNIATDYAERLLMVNGSAVEDKALSANQTKIVSTAAATTPTGNLATVYSELACLTPACALSGIVLTFNLTSPYGDFLVLPKSLVNYADATLYTEDNKPAIAVTPDGHIGVIWRRMVEKTVSGGVRMNVNLFMTVLDSSGSVVFPATDVTHNTLWFDPANLDQNYMSFFYPTLTATSDNRFIFATNRESYSNSNTIDDIYYAVRTDTGSLVADLTQVTADSNTNATEGFFDPNLATVNGTEALLSWTRNSDTTINYMVVGSDGYFKRSPSTLSMGAMSSAVQTSDGNIAIAWTNTLGNVSYAILNSSYTQIQTPTAMSNPPSINPVGMHVSVAADAQGQVILSWQDDTGSYFIYALIDSSGTIVNPPMTYLTSGSPAQNMLRTNASAKAITPYISSISSAADLALIGNSPTVFIGPGRNLDLHFQYNNHGFTTATNVVLMVTLSSGLAYVSDTLGVTPTVNGNQITWNLPDEAYMVNHICSITVNTAIGSPVGTHDTVTYAISATGDTNTANNTALSDIYIQAETFLPIIIK